MQRARGLVPHWVELSSTGKPGTGKSTWIARLIDYYLHDMSPSIKCAIVVTDQPMSDFRRYAGEYITGLSEMEKEERLMLVDGHSAIGGVESKERYSLGSIEDLGAMTDLFSDSAEEGFRAFFVDSLTPIASVIDPKHLAAQLTKLVAKLKAKEAAIFLASPAHVWDKNVTLLQNFADALLEFRHSEALTMDGLASIGLKRWLRGPSRPESDGEHLCEFRFRKSRGRGIYPGWVPFKITKEITVIALPDSAEAIKQIDLEVGRVGRMSRLPMPGIPVPMDDGTCDHLTGMMMPAVLLPSTSGRDVDILRISRKPSIFFFYPYTGSPPGEEERRPDEWLDEFRHIPGAWGSTWQAFAYTDLYDEFKKQGYHVYGVSAQTFEEQLALARHDALPYELLNDSSFKLSGMLNLPTFEFRSEKFIKRVTIVVRANQIERVFYPIYPPDSDADNVLDYVRSKQLDARVS